jgi:drug/metabolite transporter (DMT)-like permease
VAVAIGMIGVMIIIRPTSEGLGWTDLLAVFGTIFLALRDLASRLAPAEASTPLLSLYAFSSLVPLGVFLNWQRGAEWAVAPESILPLALMILLSVVGYYCVTAAMRVGDVSAVSPLRYFRLPFASIIAFFLFSEVPDSATIFGATLVVASGLYVMLREAQLSRATVKK